MDVKNAFLNGALDEEIYMRIPSGFGDKRNGGNVCKLKKSLYGLKQSARAWLKEFSLTMKSFGYDQGQFDLIFVHQAFRFRKKIYPHCICRRHCNH